MSLLAVIYVWGIMLNKTPQSLLRFLRQKVDLAKALNRVRWFIVYCSLLNATACRHPHADLT
jgi:hypothetical protein